MKNKKLVKNLRLSLTKKKSNNFSFLLEKSVSHFRVGKDKFRFISFTNYLNFSFYILSLNRYKFLKKIVIKRYVLSDIFLCVGLKVGFFYFKPKLFNYFFFNSLFILKIIKSFLNFLLSKFNLLCNTTLLKLS